MNTATSSVSVKAVRLRAKGFLGSGDSAETLTDRQTRVKGFQQARLHQASVALIGAGGICGPVGFGLVRKGIGILSIYDNDVVEVSNLCRQMFFPKDIGENKAMCLAKNLLSHASHKTEIRPYPMRIQDAVDSGRPTRHDIVICGPDNDPTRLFASRNFSNTPVVFIGVGSQAQHAYVFVQKPGQACFGCVFPDAVGDERYPCPGTPAILDVLMVVAGLTLTVIDSLIMAGRKLHWNYWDIYPNGMIASKPISVNKNENCSLCGTSGSKRRA